MEEIPQNMIDLKKKKDGDGCNGSTHSPIAVEDATVFKLPHEQEKGNANSYSCGARAFPGNCGILTAR